MHLDHTDSLIGFLPLAHIFDRRAKRSVLHEPNAHAQMHPSRPRPEPRAHLLPPSPSGQSPAVHLLPISTAAPCSAAHLLPFLPAFSLPRLCVLPGALLPPCSFRMPAAPAWYCRTAEELYLHLGASIGYWRGDIKGLMDDIGE